MESKLRIHVVSGAFDVLFGSDGLKDTEYMEDYVEGCLLCWIGRLWPAGKEIPPATSIMENMVITFIYHGHVIGKMKDWTIYDGFSWHRMHYKIKGSIYVHQEN